MKINTQERRTFWTMVAGLWAAGIAMLGVLADVLFRRK